MNDLALETNQLQQILVRLRAGDRLAQNELVRFAQARLETLTRQMLRKFPAVMRWSEADDVFQGSMIRLLRALETVEVDNTRDLINLAAFQIRRELIDLARRFNGPLGLSTNHNCVSPEIPADQSVPAGETTETAPEELDRWSSLHDAVEELPVELREVFGLTYYHAWTQAKIAELFQVDERTVRRRWLAACTSLKTSLGARFPEYVSAE